MTSSWLFPPRTREVQFDEMWSFVGKKQKNCDPADPDDDHKGDWWDHVAFDPEHKLVLAVVPGARVTESVEEVVDEAKCRLDEQHPTLMTSDEYPVYETVIEEAFSQPVVAPQEPARPGRRPLLPERRLDPGVTYATVRKERENNRVVAVHRTVVLGSQRAVDAALKASVCSRTINTSFVERQHGTARCQNARQSRRGTGTTSAGRCGRFGSATPRVAGKSGRRRCRLGSLIMSGLCRNGCASRPFNETRTPPDYREWASCREAHFQRLPVFFSLLLSDC
jgi:IS1 family transposase